MSSLSAEQVQKAIADLHLLKTKLATEERGVVDKTAELLARLEAELARLSEQVRWLSSKPFRKKQEEAPSGQLAFELLAMLHSRLGSSGASSELPAEDGGDAAPDQDGSTVSSGAIKKRPPRRPRSYRIEVEECRLSELERLCPHCSAVRNEIGVETQERLVYKPAEAFILEERRYKYACRCMDAGVEVAPAKLLPKPIPGSLASSSFLAHLAVSKLLDGMPIERVAKQLARHGIDVAPSTLNDWFARTAEMMTVLHALFLSELRTSELVSLDDTPLKAQARAHPRGIVPGRQWLYLGDVNRVLYAEFTPDWKGIHPRRVLDGFEGAIQNDGYAGINPLFVDDSAAKRVGCNDHCRRKFVQALDRGDARAQDVIDIYRALYAVERRAREGPSERRLALRQAESVPLWEQLGDTIAALEPRVSKKSPLGKAIIYWNRQQEALRAFLSDGRLPISNAHVERLIRIIALFRKNSLFVGSVGAGRRFAALLTVLLNAVLVGANPYEYLVWVIDSIADGHPSSRARELMPAAWLAAQQTAEQAPAQASA